MTTRIIIDLSAKPMSFDKQETVINNKPLATLGWCLCHYVLSGFITNSGADSMLYVQWMMDIRERDRLDLDETNYNKLKDMVEGSQACPALIKGQLFRKLIDAKSEYDKAAAAATAS